MFKLACCYQPSRICHLSKVPLHTNRKRLFTSPIPHTEIGISLPKQKVKFITGAKVGGFFLVAAIVGIASAILFELNKGKWQLLLTNGEAAEASNRGNGDAKANKGLSIDLKETYPDKNLHSLGGYEAVIDSLADLVMYLQDPEEYVADGMAHPKGVILSGPPGTGKTTLAEAVAGHAGVAYLLVPCGELQGVIVGATEANLRAIFEKAAQLAPCVICLDEIEAIAGKRVATNGHNGVHARFINSEVDQLLTLLSSVRPGVIVIGTTNHYAELDPAVIRPGRFNQHIALALPNRKERTKILHIHTSGKKLNRDVSLEDLSALTAGFAGAKIEALVNKAALAAKKQGCSVIEASHFDKALEQLEEGILGECAENLEQKRSTAGHEAGHAIVGHLLGSRLYKISVLRSGESLGRTLFIPSEIESSSKEEVLNKICRALAGRAAEELAGAPQIGCKSDFNAAKALVQLMIEEEGMGSTILGSLDEAEFILQTQLKRARTILEENRPAWERICAALMERDQLFREEFLSLMDGTPLSDKTSWFYSLFKGSKPEVKKSLPPVKARAKSSLPQRGVFTLRDAKEMAEKSPTTAKGKGIEAQEEPKAPFTIKEVANAIGISPSKIRKITSFRDGGCDIIFKPSFSEDEWMREMSKKLRNNDVENSFSTSGYGNIDSFLRIYADGMEDFIAYVKKNS